MRLKKTVAGVGAAATLLGVSALVAVPAIAQDDATDDTTVEARPFHTHCRIGGITNLADALGLDASELGDRLAAGETVADIASEEGVALDDVIAALVAEADERLQAAVADERITQEQADDKAADIEQRITDFVNGEAPLRMGRGFGGFGLDAVADVLELDATELMDQLRAGDSLADIAAAQGVDVSEVTAAIEAQAAERLDNAVADGRITQDQANEMLTNLRERVDGIVNGEAPLGGSHGFGRGGPRGFGGVGPGDVTDPGTAAETTNA